MIQRLFLVGLLWEGSKLLTGFLLGALSMFMIFRMFEIVNRDSREYSNGDKFAEIFGMCMIWVFAIGLILVFTLPVDAANTNSAMTYSAAGIK